jgi:hypothetical protein
MNDERILRELRIANLPTKIRLGALAFWICGVLGLIFAGFVLSLYGTIVRVLFGGY